MGTKLLTFLLSCFVAASAFCAETASIYPEDRPLVFRGLDDTSSPIIVEDGRATDLQNVKLSDSYALIKRHGFNKIGALLNHWVLSESFPAITGLYYAKLSSGTEYRYAFTGDSIYYQTSTTWTRMSINPTITYSKDNQYVFCTALDNIIFSNGVDRVGKTSGTSASNLSFTGLSTPPTTAKCVAWFKNYLVVANVTENSVSCPTRIRWSNVGTIETYSEDDYIDIAELGGQEINALCQINDNLYIFFTDSIWKASLVGGDELYTLEKVVEGIGCIAKNSVQVVNFKNQIKGVMFLSKNKHIYFFDGNSIVDASLYITSLTGGISATRLEYAVSSVDDDYYYLCVSDDTATTNDLLLCYQYKIAEWTRYANINANAMASVVDSNSLKQTYFGNYDSFVYQLEDVSLDSDIVGKNGSITGVGVYSLPDGSATGLQMLLVDGTINYSATGAIIYLTSGTGLNQDAVIVYHTQTGIVIDSAFTTTPDSTTLFNIGAIDAYYDTKWFDLGSPVRFKNIGKLYSWVETNSGSSISISQWNDFGSLVGSEDISLGSTGSVWGTAIWGVSRWGGESASLKITPLSNTARLVKLRFSNEDIDENFKIYGYNILYWNYDYQ